MRVLTTIRACTPPSAGVDRRPAARRAAVPYKEVATVSASSLLLAAPAHAASASSQDVAASVQSAIDTASGLATQAGAVAGEVAQGAKVAADYIKPYVDAAAPVVRDVARESVKLASPVVESGVQTALKQLKSSGVDVDGALKSANSAAEATVPVLKSGAAALATFVDAIATGDPSTVATAVGAGVLVVLLSPLLLPVVAGLLRGYTGDLTPAQTLDLLSSTDALLVDIRKASEVESKGVPVLPRGQSGKLVRVEFDGITDRALRAAMNDPVGVEAESTARIIANLKRSSPGKPVVVLDANAGLAKAVARRLAALGFRRVFCVDGGFDGRGGWVSAGLATAQVSGGGGSGRGLPGLPGLTQTARK